MNLKFDKILWIIRESDRNQNIYTKAEIDLLLEELNRYDWNVLTYSDLPNPTLQQNKMYIVQQSQWTKWLPWWMWWTYYAKWIYFSNWINWIYLWEFPYQATEWEIDSWIIDTAFISPLWLRYWLIETIYSWLTTSDKTIIWWINELDILKQDILLEWSFVNWDKTKLNSIQAWAQVNNISDLNATDLTNWWETSLHKHDNMYYTKLEINTSLNWKQNTSEKWQANWYASLWADWKIPSSQIPDLAITNYLGNFIDTTTALATPSVNTSQKWDWLTVDTSWGKTYIVINNNPTLITDIALIKTPTDMVLSVNWYTWAVILNKNDIWLWNVDNTSDLNKPVSTATQTALWLKVDKTTTLTINWTTYDLSANRNWTIFAWWLSYSNITTNQSINSWYMYWVTCSISNITLTLSDWSSVWETLTIKKLDNTPYKITITGSIEWEWSIDIDTQFESIDLFWNWTYYLIK